MDGRRHASLGCGDSVPDLNSNVAHSVVKCNQMGERKPTMSYHNFRHTDVVDQGIREHDMACIRQALTSTCPFDRTFSRGAFDDGLDYVLKVKGVSEDELYEQFDPEIWPLFASRVDSKDETLTARDFSFSVGYLTENFCPERIEDVKKLGRYLFPNEMKKPEEKVQPRWQAEGRSGNPTRRSPQRNRQKDTVRLLIVLGGAAVAVTAAVLIVRAVQKNAAKQTSAIEELTGQVELLANQLEELNVQVTQLTYQVQNL